jgi:hypothetical protein
MDIDDFCRNVVTIPQYESTCWFNAILMCLLYSQQSRKLLLTENKTFDKSNSLLSIVNKILLSNYNDKDKAQKYFNIIRPEVILSYVKDLNKPTLKAMILRGWFPNIFLYKFIEELGRTCIVLDYYDNKFYAGITQSMNIISSYDESQTKIIKKLFFGKKTTTKSKILNTQNPDYIYINIWKDDNNGYFFHKRIENYSKSNIKLSSLLLDKYGFTYSGLDTFEKIITFNGYEYILDSCINQNYNETTNHHAIAGITCKNNKYVYNGWLKSTQDAAIKKEHQQEYKENPCELIKFDWNFNDDDRNVCFNMKKCKLDDIVSVEEEKKTDLCFSFGLKKGINTLIYVRLNPLEADKKYLSKNKNDTISPTSISSQRSLKSVLDLPYSPASPLKDDEIYEGLNKGYIEETQEDIDEVNKMNYIFKQESKNKKIKIERKDAKRLAIHLKKDLRKVVHKP